MNASSSLSFSDVRRLRQTNLQRKTKVELSSHGNKPWKCIALRQIVSIDDDVWRKMQFYAPMLTGLVDEGQLSPSVEGNATVTAWQRSDGRMIIVASTSVADHINLMFVWKRCSGIRHRTHPAGCVEPCYYVFLPLSSTLTFKEKKRETRGCVSANVKNKERCSNWF